MNIASGVRSRTGTPRGSAARLFGYDVFISFALGQDARGSRNYASDLARRLRERDYTVFFSEDEAPAGGDLDDALKSALARSRILVVIANRGTLADPRWVRVEVEEFRRAHPDRPVIPISIGGALQDPAFGPPAEAWLQFSNKIWIDDSEQAGSGGMVSAEALERLVTAPTAVRASIRWRWTVRAAFSVLAGLTLAALWFAWSDRQNALLAEDRRFLAERNAEQARNNAALAEKNEARAVKNAADAVRESERALKAEGEARREAEAARAAERRALSGRLAAESQLARSGNTQLALLLAREAWAADRTQEARRALYESLHEPVPALLASGLGELKHMDYSVDGRFIAAATSGESIHLWRFDGAAALKSTLKASSGVSALAFSPDGRQLATLDDKARLQLWDPEGGVPVSAPMVAADMANGWALAWHPNGRMIAVGATGPDRRQMFRLWNLATRAPVGEPLRTKEEYGVFRMSFSPNGERLATTSLQHVHVWDLKSGKPIVPPIKARSAVRQVRFIDDGRVVFDGPGYEATTWNLRSNDAEQPSFAGHTNWVGALAHSPAARLLATGSEDMTIRLWTGDFPRPWRNPLKFHESGVSALAFNVDGTQLVSAAHDGRVVRWMLNTGAHRFRNTRVATINRGSADQTLSNDLRWVVLLWSDAGRLEWHDFATGTVQRASGEVRTAWEGLAVAPDGTVALRLKSGMLALHPRGQAKPRCTVLHAASSTEFSADGRWLVTANADDATLRVWQASDCLAIGSIPRQGADTAIMPFAFSGDGRKLLVADDERIRRWDIAQRKFDSTVGYPAPKAHVIAVDPQGRFIATGHTDGSTRLIDLQGGVRGTVLSGPHGRTTVRSLAFSADGLWLATAADDGQVALWDLEAGQLAGAPFSTGQGQLRRVAFGADSRILLTQGTDGPPAQWHVGADAWAEQACKVAQRNLSCAEWRRVMGANQSYRKSCTQWPAMQDAATCGAR